MPNNDLFLQTIEAVYASGLDRDRLPEALEATNSLIGGAGALLEVIDKPTRRHREYCSVGLPNVARAPYIEQFAALNPRIPFAFRQPRGKIICDYQVLDEDEMTRNPFYSEFLQSLGLRYCLRALLEQTPDKWVGVSVQRTRKQGHPDKREIALMQRLVPHYQRAYDVGARLKTVADRSGVLENALDWLADGVALLRADGDIIYINDTMRALAQRGDGLRLSDRTIEFAAPDSRRRFEAALGAVARIGDPSSDAHPTDFPVPRSDGIPAYIVSVRPLVGGQAHTTRHTQAKVMVLIRDPLWQNPATSQMLQQLFGLTNAEAHLAQALCAGTTTGTYALERGVSINTVYSHLKRIREKTGCKSVPELIRRLGELNVPLRLSRLS